MDTGEIINIITIATVVVSVWKYWYLGKGGVGIKGVCWLQLVTCVLQLGYNGLVVKMNPVLWASLLYQPLLVWGAVMAVKGLLAKESPRA